MCMMKKLMVCILCLASIPCFAQFRVGVQGSLSANNFWQTDGFSGVPTQEFTWETTGYRVGVFGEYDLGYSGLEFNPALMYSLNGAHIGQSQGFPPDPNLSYNFSDTRVGLFVESAAELTVFISGEPHVQGICRRWPLCLPESFRYGEG